MSVGVDVTGPAAAPDRAFVSCRNHRGAGVTADKRLMVMEVVELAEVRLGVVLAFLA